MSTISTSMDAKKKGQLSLMPIEEVPVTPDVIRSEVNLLSYPFFALSRAEIRKKTKTEYRAIIRRAGKEIEVLWQVSSNAEYGYPGPFDQRVHKAIEEILNEMPLSIRNPIGFSMYDLCRRMGMGRMGGTDYKKIKEALERIVATTVKSSGTFYAKGRKKWIDDVFHLYDRVIFKGEQLPDGSIAETNFLFLSSWYLESINSRYVRPLDYDHYKSLQSNISRRLYELLGVKFYGILRLGLAHLCYRYSTLCQLLPLTPQRYLSKARQILDPAHRELRRTGFLAKVEWEHMEEQPSDWLIYYYPGPRAKAEVEQYQPLEEPLLPEDEAETQLALPLPERQGRLNKELEQQALVKNMLETLEDEGSRAFYEKVAKLCPSDLIYRCLSEVKDEARRGQIRISKGAAFTDKIKRYCQQYGIELGLKSGERKEG